MTHTPSFQTPLLFTGSKHPWHVIKTIFQERWYTYIAAIFAETCTFFGIPPMCCCHYLIFTLTVEFSEDLFHNENI